MTEKGVQTETEGLETKAEGVKTDQPETPTLKGGKTMSSGKAVNISISREESEKVRQKAEVYGVRRDLMVESAIWAVAEEADRDRERFRNRVIAAEERAGGKEGSYQYQVRITEKTCMALDHAISIASEIRGRRGAQKIVLIAAAHYALEEKMYLRAVLE